MAFIDINDYNVDVIQSVGLPGGKLAADDNTATIPYDKATNGEVDLEYTITVPKTTRKKSYEICILLPADISPYIVCFFYQKPQYIVLSQYIIF